MPHHHDLVVSIIHSRQHTAHATGAGKIQVRVRDDLRRVQPQLFRNDPRGRKRPVGRARHDNVGSVVLCCHAPAHLRRAAATALVQRPVQVGQRQILPRRLGMANQVEDLPISIHTHFGTLPVQQLHQDTNIVAGFCSVPKYSTQPKKCIRPQALLIRALANLKQFQATRFFPPQAGAAVISG